MRRLLDADFILIENCCGEEYCLIVINNYWKTGQLISILYINYLASKYHRQSMDHWKFDRDSNHFNDQSLLDHSYNSKKKVYAPTNYILSNVYRLYMLVCNFNLLVCSESGSNLDIIEINWSLCVIHWIGCTT